MATISGSRMAANISDLAKSNAGSSHPYTCNTCQVAFRNSDLQKSHMRTDWHRYNLKRRVASLPPISSEIFTEKVLQARAASTAEADKAGFERACEACHKTYYSENQYRNHLGSAKHKGRVVAAMSKSSGKLEDDASSMVTSTFSLGPPAGAETVLDSDAEEEFNEVIEGFKNARLQERPSPVKRPSNPQPAAVGQHEDDQPTTVENGPSTSTTPNTEAKSSDKTETVLPSLKACLFCNYDSPTVPLSVVHMQRIHGMFIPEKDYLVDLEGLLSYLQRRIHELCECIYCGKAKANAFAVQTHMRDSGHCKIPYTTEEEQLEIGDFYDFRSTYSDGEEDDDESMDEHGTPGGVKLGASRQAKLAREDGEEVAEGDEGWETDSSESSLDSDDLHGVPAERHDHQYERLQQHPHHSREDQRAHHQRDGWHVHKHKPAHAVFYDDFELHLPSGKSVGHRALNRYFRQNLHNHPSPEEREERLAIEAAEAENEMNVDDHDGTKAVALRETKAHGRSVVNRENRGLGIADPRTRQASKIIGKGRDKEYRGRKSQEIGASKRLFKEYHRNHATFM